MRYFEITKSDHILESQEELTESPMADFEIHGDANTAGSFTDDDLRAIRNPKWLQKVHTAFANSTDHYFNVYIVNLKDAILPAPDRDADVHYRFDSSMNAKKYDHIGKFPGLIGPAYVEKLIGKLPPNHENCINVLLVENEGENKISLTPWMLAHRIIHALLASSNFTSREINNLMDSFAHNVASKLLFGGARWATPTEDDLLKALSYVGTTKAQINNKLNGYFEFEVEMGTQFIVNGKIKPFRNDFSNIGVDITPEIQNKMNNYLIEMNEKFNIEFRELLYGSVGQFCIL